MCFSRVTIDNIQFNNFGNFVVIAKVLCQPYPKCLSWIEIIMILSLIIVDSTKCVVFAPYLIWMEVTMEEDWVWRCPYYHHYYYTMISDNLAENISKSNSIWYEYRNGESNFWNFQKCCVTVDQIGMAFIHLEIASLHMNGFQSMDCIQVSNE